MFSFWDALSTKDSSEGEQPITRKSKGTRHQNENFIDQEKKRPACPHEKARRSFRDLYELSKCLITKGRCSFSIYLWLSALLQHLPSDPQQFVVAQELNEKATIAAAPIRIRIFFIRVIMTKILDKYLQFCNQKPPNKINLSIKTD